MKNIIRKIIKEEVGIDKSSKFSKIFDKDNTKIQTDDIEGKNLGFAVFSDTIEQDKYIRLYQTTVYAKGQLLMKKEPRVESKLDFYIKFNGLKETGDNKNIFDAEYIQNIFNSLPSDIRKDTKIELRYSRNDDEDRSKYLTEFNSSTNDFLVNNQGKNVVLKIGYKFNIFESINEMARVSKDNIYIQHTLVLLYNLVENLKNIINNEIKKSSSDLELIENKSMPETDLLRLKIIKHNKLYKSSEPKEIEMKTVNVIFKDEKNIIISSSNSTEKSTYVVGNIKWFKTLLNDPLIKYANKNVQINIVNIENAPEDFLYSFPKYTKLTKQQFTDGVNELIQDFVTVNRTYDEFCVIMPDLNYRFKYYGNIHIDTRVQPGSGTSVDLQELLLLLQDKKYVLISNTYFDKQGRTTLSQYGDDFSRLKNDFIVNQKKRFESNPKYKPFMDDNFTLGMFSAIVEGDGKGGYVIFTKKMIVELLNKYLDMSIFDDEVSDEDYTSTFESLLNM